MQESQPKLSEREIAQAWAQITVKRWKRNLSRMNIGQMSSGELLRSFQYKVLAGAGGDVLKIEFAFKYYGKFVDMGVGRGTSLGDHPQSRTGRRFSPSFSGMIRKPKKWYSKSFYAETQRLLEIMKEEYGHKGQLLITEHLSDSAING